MAMNMAQKRARKAQRQKQRVAARRKAEALEASLPARVLRAAQAPIHCLLTEGIFDVGMGTLVLVRGATPDRFAMSLFLVDVFCLGVKDVSADASDAVFQFGRDGKPIYIPGPNDTAAMVRRRVEHLQKYLGNDGFGAETTA
mgnify:CR=1 FL=1